MQKSQRQPSVSRSVNLAPLLAPNGIRRVRSDKVVVGEGLRIRFVMDSQQIRTQKSRNGSCPEVGVVRSIENADQFWPFRYGRAHLIESESLRHHVASPLIDHDAVGGGVG